MIENRENKKTKMHSIRELLPPEALPLDGCPVRLRAKNRVHILALGDVGTTTLLGLRLLGGDVISGFGLSDIRTENVRRLELEMGQMDYPFGFDALPPVYAVDEDKLFDCDVLVFCASRGVPPVQAAGEDADEAAPDAAHQDVRMAQLEANREIIRHYGILARQAHYGGLIAVVSDPVDPLCSALLDASGLPPWQIQGYGLGVMHTRACHYARQEPRFSSYLWEGCAYGPHGADLVLANSLTHYNDALSRALTRRVIAANQEIRALGYKPYLAPAISSAALSILLTLRGEWHYSSLYFGNRDAGAFLGIKNRMTADGPAYEDAPLPAPLYQRIHEAYDRLCALRHPEKD